MSDFGLPRRKLPWFPSINYDACASDLECLNFCPHDVFEWDPDTGRPVVAHPYNCVPGCISCAQACKAQAISLPSQEEFCALLRQLRGKGRGARPAAGISKREGRGPTGRHRLAAASPCLPPRHSAGPRKAANDDGD
jgi:NAD-dependent dihydropyrimidine dehydrogenase PreA subunit